MIMQVPTSKTIIMQRNSSPHSAFTIYKQQNLPNYNYIPISWFGYLHQQTSTQVQFVGIAQRNVWACRQKLRGGWIGFLIKIVLLIFSLFVSKIN